MNPTDSRFTKEHEWARREGDEVVVGITEYAQNELGDVVYVELPALGSTVTQGQTFGVVESVKAASDLFAPVSGEVVAINTDLQDKPELVNQEPYQAGWMLRVRLANPAELAALLDAAAYDEYLKTLH